MFSRFSSSVPKPCVRCNKTELDILHRTFEESDKEFWVYKCAAVHTCSRCDKFDDVGTWNHAVRRYGRSVAKFCCHDPYMTIQVPIDMETVGIVERSVHAASTATKGSEFRSHGTFISHLVTLDCSERYKQALCSWAPTAMMAFMRGERATERILRKGRLSTIRPPPGLEEKAPISTAPSSPTIAPSEAMMHMEHPPANAGCEAGMEGTSVKADAYGEETRVSGASYSKKEPTPLAYPIGPDLIPCEVMESSADNLKAGLAKRVQPLPFRANKDTVRKIDRTVTAMMREVFSADKIKEWRKKNPCVEEMGSSKWSSDRFVQAMEDAMSDTRCRIEQTFQIKQNECLPAKGKAPRPIIQCGDRAQVMMCVPVKCFEELLFQHFDEASIKHLSKFGAMERIADRFKGPFHIVEGDGSAWDACCNARIRELTENRVMRHIMKVLGNDHEIPRAWFDQVIDDMEKDKLKGKAKVVDQALTPFRVLIESIRQSGHRGTSCFNYFINIICWLVVLCDKPEAMIKRTREGELPREYVSARDGQKYTLLYAFEGDDSAICTTEDLKASSDDVESLWTKLGFRMKLVYVKHKMTFTGFDFLCGKQGTTGVFLPEIVRNIASSAWSCSSELKQHPERVHTVGAAAMLARAENFVMCGPFSRYFAAIGLAHVRRGGDLALEEVDAMRLGIAPVASVKERLQELYDTAEPMSKDMRFLVNQVVSLSREQELSLLSVDFGDNPYDVQVARRVIPFAVWDPKKFEKARR